MRYSHALLCLLTTLVPQGVQAQLRGTVSDIEGQPLSAAEVEIWGSTDVWVRKRPPNLASSCFRLSRSAM